MSAGSIAERYAQAIFELGVETGQLTALVEGLSQFAATYSTSEELKTTLADPVLPKAERENLLTEIAKRIGVSELGIRSLIVMASRGRLGTVAEVVDALTKMADGKEGVVRAQVTTARAMPDAYYDALTKKLEAATRRKVILEHQVDSSLVAGAVARVGDAVIDASVRGRLAKLERDVLSALSVD